MQDGARLHGSEQVFSFFHECVMERVVVMENAKCAGRSMGVLSYSPDLTPRDYFLWVALNYILYRSNPTTLDELEQFICKAIESISVQTL